MLYQISKRYIIRLLMMFINIIMLAIIGNEAPILMFALLIILIALTWVLFSYDRFSYRPSLLIKLYIAVNSREASTFVRDIRFQIDKIVSAINIDENYDINNISTDYKCLTELHTLVKTIIKKGFIAGEPICVRVPDFASWKDNKQYSLNRNDIAPILPKFETLLERIERQLNILKPLIILMNNQDNKDTAYWVDDVNINSQRVINVE